jgi:cytochrome c peroxidase
MKKIASLLIIALSLLILACNKQTDTPPDPKPEVLPDYDPTPYSLDYSYFPNPTIPEDNLLTNQKVLLGRMLFYEKKLSKGETQSCADCHMQEDGFSDIRQFSIGVDELPGRRQAMAIFNMAWHTNGFFWDGRAPSLRDQALKPIQDPLEMNETLENVIAKLQATKDYRFQFARAFENSTITAEKMGLAMEQFMNTILSMNSKYDQYLLGNATLSESEQRGYDLFFTEFDPNGLSKGGECFHCHAGVNFTNNKYMNNGLDDESSFTDLGYFETTADDADKAKFKVPSLRNIAVTPPYMHDGRFATLEEVLNHYNHGVKNSSTVDKLMQYNISPGLQLTEQDKADIIAFLNTLTDESYLVNKDYSSPF